MDLDTNLLALKGVGTKNIKRLNKIGIFKVSDLFFYYPRAYLDFTTILNIESIGRYVNQKATIRGKISEIGNKRTSRRKFYITEAIIEDGTGSLKVVWFNQPFIARMLKVGSEVILNGKIEFNYFSREVVMVSPERTARPSIIPIYGETVGMTSNYISKLIKNCSSLIKNIEEWLPKNIIERHGLLSINNAISQLHFPRSMEDVRQAQRRIAFDELFLIALKSNLTRVQIAKEHAPIIEVSDDMIAKFVKDLPFELTADQKKASWEVIKDLKSDKPMNRLLNGDVGSGKTVVAAIGAYAALRSGFKTILMAPTEILAKQHYETFKKLFSNSDVGLLTSSKKENIEAGVMVGTHALLQEKHQLNKIGLVIVDEQHRFGVEQRSQLLKTEAGIRPHFLSMTATPIPRTLHLALFGDLDFSIIKEKPSNRKEIKTRFVNQNNREKAYEFIRKQLQSGRQAFIICPLIEDMKEGEGLFDERKTVIAESKKLKTIFPEFNIGTLHGRMKPAEKDEIMSRFQKGSVNILVSTSVVEVGVDIPNASVMVIEDAERFGLAQIHQFRGRVGRAEHQSFCFLFSSTISQKALQRLTSIETTSDGFKLAEIDLETRGPGAVFGTEQSGVLDLKMASVTDSELVQKASEAAKSIIESDPNLSKYSQIRKRIADFLENKHLE